MEWLRVPRDEGVFVHAAEEPMGLLAWAVATEAERQAPQPVNICRTEWPAPWCTCMTYWLEWTA